MPEAACLHIQARDSEPVRVVDLSGVSVRIGRASYCEVRIPEPQLAEEVCYLRRRGSTWHLVPVAVPSAVSIDGRAVERPCPLPFGVPLRVGDHSLTLRPAGASPPEWGTFEAPTPVEIPASRPRSSEAYRTRPTPPSTGPVSDAARESLQTNRPDADGQTDHLSRWQSRRAAREEQVKATRDETRWEDRWRAVGERIREKRNVASVAATPPQRPEGWDNVELPRRDSVRPNPARPATTDRLTPDSMPEAPVATLLRNVDPPSARAGTFAGVDRPEAPAVDLLETAPPTPVVETWTPPRIDRPELKDQSHFQAPAPEGLGRSLARRERPAPEDDRPQSQIEAAVVLLPAPMPPRPAPPALAEPGLSTALRPLPASPEAFQLPAPSTTATSGGPDRELDRPVPSERETASIVEPAQLVQRRNEERRIASERGGPRSSRSRPALRADDRTARRRVRDPEAPSDPTPTQPSDAGEATGPWPSTWADHAPFVTDTDQTGLGSRSRNSGAFSSQTTTAYHEPAEDRKQARNGAAGARRTARRPMDDTRESAESRRGSRPADPAPRKSTGQGTGRGRQAAEALGPCSEWPSVHDILAAHGSRAERQERARAAQPSVRRDVLRQEPTVSRPPDHWTLPLWLGWLPLTLVSIALGTIGVAMAFAWSRDASMAGVAAAAASASGGGQKTPLDIEDLPGTSWRQTTAANLARWAEALGRGGDDNSRENARSLLDAAGALSPYQANARYELARLAPDSPEGTSPAVSLGLSRDILALAWSGHQLVKAGKKDAARRAYHAALEMATHASPSRLPMPAYLDDPQIRRYALPGEEIIGAIIHDMLAHSGWAYSDASLAFPDSAVVHLVAARQLRDKTLTESDAALDAALAPSRKMPLDAVGAAIHIAAQAEAHALRSNWNEASRLYREAIARMPLDTVRRSWWINVADMEQRLNDEDKRQQALEAARSSDPSDPITKRAFDFLKISGFRSGTSDSKTREQAKDTTR